MKAVVTGSIRLNAFDMNYVGLIRHGIWAHPPDTSASLCLADIVGSSDVYRDSPHSSIITGVRIPVNNPMLLIPRGRSGPAISASVSPTT
jgi:long-chain alkane monooxygenase